MTAETRNRLAELRALAEKATPGPWVADVPGFGTVFAGDSIEGRGVWLFDRIDATAADADYIAAVDPQTVLALLDVAEAALEHRRERTHVVTGNMQWADGQLDAALARLEATR